MIPTVEQTEQKVTRSENNSPLRVCFVCTGNTCRSPMAAAVANSLANELRAALPESVRESVLPSVEAISAGLAANEGEPIAQNAVLALQEAGITPISNHDYRTHTAHLLLPEIAMQCDRIIGLSGSHVMGLLMRFPELAGRIVGMPQEISDPYGGDLEIYRKCLAEITAGVKALLFPTAL